MRRSILLFVLSSSFAALAGCTGNLTDPIADPFAPSATEPWSGTVNAQSCGLSSTPPANVACAGTFGEPAFALAICGDLAADNTLTVENRPGVEGAAVAVDGKSRTSSPLRIGGSFTTVLGNEANNTQDIDGSLLTGGAWTVSSPAHVRGDAFASRLDAKNTVGVDGTLYVGTLTGENVKAGNVVRTPVNVTSPLDCARAPNIAGIVRDARKPSYSPYAASLDALASVKEKTDVRLGCAHYRFDSIGVDDELTIRVEGATTIVVDGDFRIAGPTRFELAPGSSLELVVGGALSVDNTLTIEGGGAYAWVGVGGALRIAAPMRLDGWLVAPRTVVAADNTLTLRGAALVGGLVVASPMVVRSGPSLSATGCIAPETAFDVRTRP